MAAKTPPVKETEVIAQRLLGKPKARIARELALNVDTVTRILDSAQVDALSNEAKSILVAALPDSARTIAKSVKKSSRDAWELLDRTKVLPKTGDETRTSIGVAINFDGMPNLK
jgi:hypothetical protein